MALIGHNRPISPPFGVYRPLRFAYHALLPFVPQFCADRPFVGQNTPVVSFGPQNRPFVSFVPQNRPFVISKLNPGCLKSFKKKFLEKKFETKFRKFTNPKQNLFFAAQR
jgi:hypothetical protein